MRVVGHLRPVKDPLLVAQAARLLPATSRLRVEHIGDSLDDALARSAREEMRTNSRWKWLGSRSRLETLRAIASAHLLVLSSRSEGGPGVVAEAVMASTPVLATRIDGVLGMLGAAHSGLFDVGDAAGLARLLERAETDESFLRELVRAGDASRPSFERERELAAWHDLLGEIRACR
ncbi:MAG: glycosyltransferase [Planctomycetaceae bacterium]|nr:glycosyltransferase [Planctomycetaceae bacterium]